MKKLFCLMLAGLSVMILNAQEIKKNAVPELVVKAFESKYPGVKAKWEKEDNNYEATFKKDEQKTSVVISSEGTIIETETSIKIVDLHPQIIKYVKEHFKGNKIMEAAKIVDSRGVVMYEVEIQKKDILFDSLGNFIKEKAIEKEEDDKDN